MFSINTKKLTGISILGALSAILFYIEIPIVLFYKLDLSNLPVLIGTFAFGPYSGFLILLIKDLTGLLHTSTAGVGELADFIIAAVYIIICGIFYNKNKTRKSALLGMLISTLASGFVGILVNRFLLIPLLVPSNGLEVVTSMGKSVIPYIDTPSKFLLLITGPFNIFKGVVISFSTFLLYKRLSPILHKTINS